MQKSSLRVIATLILITPHAVFPQSGSTLEQFEIDATKDRATEEHPHEPRSTTNSKTYDGGLGYGDDDDDGELLGDSLFWWIPEAIGRAMVAGGTSSWRRVTSPTRADDIDENAEFEEPTVARKTEGEGVIPYARVDVSYNWMNNRIHANDSRTEIGFGPLGFQLRNTRYYESDPEADLHVRQYHALYRMSASDFFEVDIGFGKFELIGVSSHSGESFTLPVLIHPSTRFGFEYRPSWTSINGTGIADYELAMSFGDRYWSVRGGYRWLKSPGARLEGPFLGLSGRI
jgi:hypothetical protein